ncbi:hypothetical protein MTO96_027677 [Rhipicephalus appendiculatus]
MSNLLGVVYKRRKYGQYCTETIHFFFYNIYCHFNMNGLVGVNALVWVAVALAVMINEAAASLGAASTFHPKPSIEASATYLERVNMNGLVGVNALVWIAVALAVMINEAAALGAGIGSGSGGVGFPRPSGGSGGFTIGKK